MEICAEMPLSSTNLARPLGWTRGRRGGKESPRLNLHGVTGVLGPVLMELGVLAMIDEWELERDGNNRLAQNSSSE